MFKIKYDAVGSGYVWHVVTGEGVLVVGEVYKDGTTWKATVTHKDGEECRTPNGGRYSAHRATRKQACEGAARRVFEREVDHWLRLMNT